MALSSEQVEHSVTIVYYACVFTPFIFLGAWNTLALMEHQWRIRVQMIAIILMFLHAANYLPLWSAPISGPLNNNLLITQRFIDQIPLDASVLSGRKAMTYLANRKNLYAFKDYLDGRHYISRKKFHLSDDVDYVLVDYSEFSESKVLPRVTAFNFDNRFKLQESIEEVALYVRNKNNEPTNALVQRRKKSFASTGILRTVYENSIVLEDIQYPLIYSNRLRIFPTTMMWKVNEKLDVDLMMELSIKQGHSIVYQKRRTIGSTIYPTMKWAKGEYVKEDYNYLIPRLDSGQYTLEIKLFNSKSSKPINCSPILSCHHHVLVKQFVVLE
jgi:hypothetical protein